MVRAAIKAMQKEGVSKISLVAFKDNHIGNAFWQGIGWTEREDFNSYEFILNEENIIRFVKKSGAEKKQTVAKQKRGNNIMNEKIK